MLDLGFNPDELVGVDGGRCKVWPTLEEEAWIVWKGNRETHVGKSEGLIPEPSWVAEYEASLAV